MKKPSLISQVAKRYGTALFEAVLDSAEGSKQKSAVEKALINARGTLTYITKNVVDFFENPVCSDKDKTTVLKLLAQCAQIDPKDALFMPFLELMLKAQRAFAMDEALKFFIGQGEQYLGVAQGTLTSVTPLSESESKEIQKFVGQFLNKTVTLEQELDPSLLSGFVVRVDGFSLDASLKFELNEMRNLLNEKSR